MSAPSAAVGAARRFANNNRLRRYGIPLVLILLGLAYPWWYDLPGISFVTLDLLGSSSTSRS